MKKLFYLGLLGYVFWMDEEQKKPIFESMAKGLDRVPDILRKIPGSTLPR